MGLPMPVDTPGHVPKKVAAIEAARADEPGAYLMEVMIRAIHEAGAKQIDDCAAGTLVVGDAGASSGE